MTRRASALLVALVLLLDAAILFGWFTPAPVENLNGMYGEDWTPPTQGETKASPAKERWRELGDCPEASSPFLN